jgi:L-alanine-DL-glutamate epimerase-like enolase superfamily enzyme
LRTANLTAGNQIMHQLLVEDLIAAPDLTPVRGRVGLLEKPGLGIELDRDAVRRAAELYEKDERYHHS